MCCCQQTWLQQLSQTSIPQCDIQLQSRGCSEGLRHWASPRDSQELLSSAGKLCKLCKSTEGSRRDICCWLPAPSQPSCHRALAGNEKTFLKSVVLSTLTWLFEAFVIIALQTSSSFMWFSLQIVNNYRSPLRWKHLSICCKSFLTVIQVLFTLSPDHFMC